MSDYSNDLIFGKDKTENIVSIELNDEIMYLFKEKDGVVTREVRPNQFWLLTHNKASSKQQELQGNQYFKYIAKFDTHQDWQNAKKACKRNNFEVYTVNESKEHALIYNGMTYFKGMKPSDVSVLFFDIEGLGFTHDNNARVTIITNVYRSGKGELKKKYFFLDDYDEDQAQMITDWCDWVREVNPSIIAAHNCFGYDFPYLQHVAELFDVELKLGRNNNAIQFAPYTSMFRKDGSQSYEYTNCWIHGREITDTMYLALKYDIGRSFPSYALKSIIKHLGLEKPGRTFVDASKMNQYWNERNTNPEMWNKVKQYAIEDADDLMSIYDLMMPSFFYFNQSVSKSLQGVINGATGSAINNMMVRSYLQENHSIPKASEKEHFEGGISLGISGVYSNCLKWDLVSAYPHTIIQFNLYDKEKDPEANFLTMVKYFTKERVKNKKLAKETGDIYYKNLEASQKIIINSFFGFCGAPGLQYNAPDIAAEITRKCREYIVQSIKWSTGRDLEYWKTLNNEEPEETDSL